MASLSIIVAISLIVVLASLCAVQSELYTAQVEMEPLHDAQQHIIDKLNDYIHREEKRLDDIRGRIDRYLDRMRKSKSELVTNPINAFLLVKGLTVDLDDALGIAGSEGNKNELNAAISKLKQDFKFPTYEDLTGAADALSRLQNTYLLSPADIARGSLDTHCCTTKLNADDLFELGRQSYNHGNHDDTVVWMTEALLRYEEESVNRTSSKRVYPSLKADILEYLAFSMYKQGDVTKAIDLTTQLVSLVPDHPRAVGNVEHYEKILTDQKGEDGGITDQTLAAREKRSTVDKEKEIYASLCRGESQVRQKGVKCFYYHGGNKYLLLGPIKTEVAHIKPNIWIHHDVMLDSEISTIKQLAKPKFKRATVHDQKTGELVYAHYRISKSSWLRDEDHEVVKRVCQRVNAVTGLNLKTAEELQIVNYGLGGHYEPHFDFARTDEKDAFETLGAGNRIATFLFYMSDVEAGGATVFPEIKLTLWPKKGSAAFWYNLHEDGNGDYKTRHAACPILLGTKWVANKWIHERGQEFIRPCKLQSSGVPAF